MKIRSRNVDCVQVQTDRTLNLDDVVSGRLVERTLIGIGAQRVCIGSIGGCVRAARPGRAGGPCSMTVSETARLRMEGSVSRFETVTASCVILNALLNVIHR